MNRILEYALIVAGINEEYQTSVIEGIVEFAHGKNRIIPMLATRLIGDVLIVRKDLMEAWGLGYDDLVTLDQWHDVLTKAMDDLKYFLSRHRVK